LGKCGLGQVDEGLIVVLEGIGGQGFMGFGQAVAEVFEQSGLFLKRFPLVFKVGFQFGLTFLEIRDGGMQGVYFLLLFLQGGFHCGQVV